MGHFFCSSSGATRASDPACSFAALSFRVVLMFRCESATEWKAAPRQHNHLNYFRLRGILRVTGGSAENPVVNMGVYLNILITSA